MASPLLIRPARAVDLHDVLALERVAFTHYAISPRQMRYLQQRDSAIFLVARQGEALAGDAIALLRRHAGGGVSGRIYSVVVDGRFRGQGIGRQLVKSLLARLARHGVRRVYLEVEQRNAGAIRLYEKAGFRVVKIMRGYYSRAVHGVKMRYDVRAGAE